MSEAEHGHARSKIGVIVSGFVWKCLEPEVHLLRSLWLEDTRFRRTPDS